MFDCLKCGKEFGSKMSLAGHLSQCGKEYKTCDVCGKKISQYNFSTHQKSHQKDKPCLSCGKTTKTKFCSCHCAAVYYNKKATTICPNCNNVFFVWKTNRKCTCCSRKCSDEWKTKQFIQKWKNGEVLGGTTWKVSRHVRKYLLEKQNNGCSICKGTEWNGMAMPLILDHENGNAEDNSEANLRLVCGNCGMQLPTFTGRNKGKGRAFRRDRYKKIAERQLEQ